MVGRKLIVIGGPTAAGKTCIAVELAQWLETEIISADSRQIFREMTIGTAVPSPAELSLVPHHFIQSHSIHQDYSVGQYETEALSLLNELFEKYQTVVLTGGSGLYIKAVCEGMDVFPEVPVAIRNAIALEYQEKGLAYLQSEINRLDPEYAAQVDMQNPHRLIRALAVCRVSGLSYSSFRKGGSIARNFEYLPLAIDPGKEVLIERINHRVDDMMAAGLLEEARSLYEQRHLTPLQTVGYQELFDYLAGKTTLAEAVSLIKIHTRQYAKRQRTWFNRQGEWTWFPPEDITLIKEQARKFLFGNK